MKLRAKILFVLGFLLILGFIFVLPHGHYRHAVEAYKKEILAKGEKLTLEELAPQPCTNPANGAKAFIDVMASYHVPDDYPTNMIPVVPGLKEVGFNNGAANLTSNYTENCELMARLRKVLEAPVLQFTVDYSQGFDAPLPHLAKLKSAELLATITITQALHANDLREAHSDLLAAVSLICLSTNEPFIISGLVRVAMAQIALSATWEALQSDTWIEPQLKELQSRLQQMDLFKNSAAAFGLERAGAIDALAKFRQAPKLYYTVFGSPTLIPPISSPSNGLSDKIMGSFVSVVNRMRFWRWKSSWSFEEELYLLRTESAAMECSHSAAESGAFVPALQAFNRQASNIEDSFPDRTNTFLFGGGINGQFERYLNRYAITETARRLCVTAIALKRYHLQHDIYPATLNELVPVYLPAVAADFMDGKPLRYRLRPDGDFLLYSVGLDGVDDGGDPRPLPPSLSKNWLDGRDIVWPRVATPTALEEYHRLSQSTSNTPGK